jgi:hypothetical protein
MPFFYTLPFVLNVRRRLKKKAREIAAALLISRAFIPP